MPRHGQRTAEEASAAGSEAFKGGVVGAAKVQHAHVRNSLDALPLFSISLNFAKLQTTDMITATVGSHRRRSRLRRLLHLSDLQKPHHPIQSVRSRPPPISPYTSYLHPHPHHTPFLYSPFPHRI